MAYPTAQRDNLALVRRLFDEGFSRCDVNTLNEVLAEDFVMTASGAVAGDAVQMAGNRQTLVQGMLHNHACFANWRFDLLTLLADNDMVVVRWRANGIHRGSFLGEGPSGKKVALEGTSIFEVRGGRILRDWVYATKYEFLQQLGLLPGAAGADGDAGKALVEAFWRGVINAHDPDYADRLMAAGYRQHSKGIGHGPEGFKAFLRDVLATSKGMRASVTDMLSVDNLVICRTTIAFETAPPGWAIEQSIVDVFRTDGQRLTEHWDVR